MYTYLEPTFLPQFLLERLTCSSHSINKMYILKIVSSSDYSKLVVTPHSLFVLCGHKHNILSTLLNNLSELQGEGTSAKVVFGRFPDVTKGSWLRNILTFRTRLLSNKINTFASTFFHLFSILRDSSILHTNQRETNP